MNTILWSLGAAAFVIGGVWYFVRDITRPTSAEEEGVFMDMGYTKDPGELARLNMKLSDIQDARQRSDALPASILLIGCAMLLIQFIQLVW
jgi:hypothetical protein